MGTTFSKNNFVRNKTMVKKGTSDSGERGCSKKRDSLGGIRYTMS